MARTQTLVQLNDALLAALDQRAAQRGVSRSQLVREAIEQFVASDLEAEVTRRIIEGYEREPQGSADEWGDPLTSADVTARELHRRLDREEAEAGHDPW